VVVGSALIDAMAQKIKAGESVKDATDAAVALLHNIRSGVDQ